MTDIIRPEEMGAYWQVTTPRKRTPLKRAPLTDLTNSTSRGQSSTKRSKKAQLLIPPSPSLSSPLSSPVKSPTKQAGEFLQTVALYPLNTLNLLTYEMGASLVLLLIGVLRERGHALHVLSIRHKKLPSEVFSNLVDSISLYCPNLRHLSVLGPSSRTYSTVELIDLATCLPQLLDLKLVGIRMDAALPQLSSGAIADALPSFISPLVAIVCEMVGQEDSVGAYFGNRLKLMPNLLSLEVIPCRCFYDGMEEWTASILAHPSLKQIAVATGSEVCAALSSACFAKGISYSPCVTQKLEKTPKKFYTWQAGGSLRAG